MEELRHSLRNITNLGQKKSAKKLTNYYYQSNTFNTLRTLWGIFQYKRMLIATSLAGSEVRERIRKQFVHVKM